MEISLSKIKALFRSNEKRDVVLRNNIMLSLLSKAVSLATSLLIVPATLGYLDNEVYGIWLTITSILMWFSYFDIGLGNGMRNYLTQAISTGDFAKARAYLSTTLCALTVIAIGLGLLSILPLAAVDYNALFNTQSLPGSTLRDAMTIAVLFTLANFVVRNISLVFAALQKYALGDMLTACSGVISLLIIVVLTKTTEGNLFYVVTALTFTPVAVYGVAAVPVFRHYKNLRPSLRDFDKSLLRRVVGKGLGFFFIQITSCLVIYGSSNLMVTRLCGPECVTTYNIAYKFFNLLAVGYIIVLSPMWNAYTDAYVKGDMQWIRRTFRRAMRIWGLTLVGGAVMLAICGVFYRIWVDGMVDVPFSVSLSVFAYISMFNLNSCATILINGLNKIRVQEITSGVFTVVYIALVLLVGRRFGIEGIVLSMAAAYAAMALIHYYQCRLIIKGRARGIWNK